MVFLPRGRAFYSVYFTKPMEESQAINSELRHRFSQLQHIQQARLTYDRYRPGQATENAIVAHPIRQSRYRRRAPTAIGGATGLFR